MAKRPDNVTPLPGPEPPARRVPRQAAPAAEKEHCALLAKALSCVLPKSEARWAAAELVRKYGSLSHVLAVPPQEIQAALGLKAEAAQLLALLAEISRAALEDQAAGIRRIFDTESAVVAMRPLFVGRRKEAIGFMVLDGRGRVLFNDIVIEGEVSEVPLYVRRLVQLCIEYDATTAIMAHNHPSGNPLPSRNDIVATRQVDLALRGIRVAMLDHIIYADEAYFTFSGTQVWKDTQASVQDYFRQQLELARAQEQEYLQKGRGNPYSP